MLRHPLPQLLVISVFLDLLDSVLINLYIIYDPAWLIFNDLLQNILQCEDDMQGDEPQDIHRMIIVWHVFSELFGGEDDDVHADNDAEIADEF